MLFARYWRKGCDTKFYHLWTAVSQDIGSTGIKYGASKSKGPFLGKGLSLECLWNLRVLGMGWGVGSDSKVSVVVVVILWWKGAHQLYWLGWTYMIPFRFPMIAVVLLLHFLQWFLRLKGETSMQVVAPDLYDFSLRSSFWRGLLRKFYSNLLSQQ